MKSRRIEMGGACGMYAGEERCVRSGGRAGGKEQLRRHGRKWEDNIKMDSHEVGWGHGLD